MDSKYDLDPNIFFGLTLLIVPPFGRVLCAQLI
jgi:hypothetical protein